MLNVNSLNLEFRLFPIGLKVGKSSEVSVNGDLLWKPFAIFITSGATIFRDIKQPFVCPVEERRRYDFEADCSHTFVLVVWAVCQRSDRQTPQRAVGLEDTIEDCHEITLGTFGSKVADSESNLDAGGIHHG
jgi:hypothetical protein